MNAPTIKKSLTQSTITTPTAYGPDVAPRPAPEAGYQTESITDRIKAYQKAGINCLPALGPNDEKKSEKAPNGPWKELGTKRQSENDYKRLIESRGINAGGIGIICGITSGIEALDFDNMQAYEDFLELAEKAGLGALIERIAAGYEERSPKGVHWLYRIKLKASQAFPGNQKWATKGPIGKIETLIETRGQGGYIVTAPSWNTYQQTKGGPSSIIEITFEEREQLRSIATMLSENEPEPAKTKSPAKQSPPATTGGHRPIELYNKAHDWNDILAADGWKLIFSRGEQSYWKRPNKKGPGCSGVSGPYKNGSRSSFTNFSSNAGNLPCGEALSYFDYFMHTKHGGNFEAAYMAVMALYPKPTPIVTKAITTDKPTATLPAESYHLLEDGTDRGNAHRLLAQRAPDCKFIATWQKWLTWTGTHWEIDEVQQIQKWYKVAVEENYTAVVKWLAANVEHAPEKWKTPKDEKKTAEYIKYSMLAAFLKKSRNTSKMNAALTSTESENVTHHHDELNLTKDLLVAKNGTIELATATLRPSRREDMLTTAGVTAYKTAAPCPRWIQFLEQIFIQKDSAQADHELIKYIQLLIGCSVTGRATRENILPIFYGGGGNGKSVFLSTIREVLGADIAYGADPGFLMESRASQHQTSIASIFGKRLIIAVEPPQSSRLNTALVKSITGGDQLACRRMREDEWFFTPECLLILCTNELPRISETSDGIWRRVRLVEFLAKFNDANKDPRLQEKLLGEREGILNWIVQGARDYLANGLTAPARVMQATQQYRNSEDVVQGWLDECAIIANDSSVKTKGATLQESFTAYCERNQIRSNSKDLANGLNQRGIIKRRLNGSWWVGIKIIDT